MTALITPSPLPSLSPPLPLPSPPSPLPSPPFPSPPSPLSPQVLMTLIWTHRTSLQRWLRSTSNLHSSIKMTLAIHFLSGQFILSGINSDMYMYMHVHVHVVLMGSALVAIHVGTIIILTPAFALVNLTNEQKRIYISNSWQSIVASQIFLISPTQIVNMIVFVRTI